MQNRFLNPGASDTAGRCLVLTGARRTGTSILANLLYSVVDVELSFEPPALRSLFTLLDEIDDHHWRFLFDTYLFEDFLIGALAGRRLNFNGNDDSCVYRARDKAEIDARLAKGHRQIALAPAAENKVAAFKLPDINPYLGSFRRVAPAHRALVMLRNPSSVVHSLMRMEWLGDARLAGISADWPHRRMTPVPAPHWVEDAHMYDWDRWSPLERCCYYYCRMYEGLSAVPDLQTISFESFIKNPVPQFDQILYALGLSKGERTIALLDGIHDPDTKYPGAVDGMTSAWRDRMQSAYQDCLGIAVNG